MFEHRIGLLHGQRPVQERTHSSGLVITMRSSWAYEVILGKSRAFYSKAVGLRIAVSGLSDSKVAASVETFVVGCPSHYSYLYGIKLLFEGGHFYCRQTHIRALHFYKGREQCDLFKGHCSSSIHELLRVSQMSGAGANFVFLNNMLPNSKK